MRKILFAITLLLYTSCHYTNQNDSKIIRLKGSDTMYVLSRHWAESYMKTHPQTSVYYEGGGTGSGARALANGSVDICTASRPLRPEEAQILVDFTGSLGVSHRVAKDALCIYLHPANPVNSLTLEQVEKIYLGEIINWDQVGGNNAAIELYDRLPNSGTHLYLREHVLDGEAFHAEHILSVASAADMVAQVSEDVNAIGYGGIIQHPGIKFSKINNIEPMPENIQNDSYPIIRYLYLYTPNTPQGHVKRFIDWVLGPQGQAIVEQTGFFPIWQDS